MMKILKTSGAIMLLLVAISCEQNDQEILKPVDDSSIFMDLPAFTQKRVANGRTGKQLVVFSAEYITAAGSEQIGRTVYFNNVGNKKLTADFVPGYSVDGSDNVSYYIDETRPSDDDISVATTSAAITRAMNSWDDVTCSDLKMFQVPFDPLIETGFVAADLEIPGIPGGYNIVADVVHAGWLPAVFFDEIVPGGSEYILGVTFTIIYFENGQPTDIDNNGKADVALREIYYNDAFEWADGDDGATFDIETIALHEAGHGLSQGHFGKAFSTNSNRKLHFSPRAVMNAAYSGERTIIGATDNAGHCSNWGSWPNN